MNSFGWLIGVEYSKHLSQGDDARFACILVTNWARGGPAWTIPDDSAVIPQLSAAQCQAEFGDWLTPWCHAPVQWRLWKLVETPALKLVPMQATPAPTTRTPAASQAIALRQEGVIALTHMTEGHTDAMRLVVDGVHADQSPVLSYPLAVAGMAHMTAALSDSAFGMSRVMRVSVSAEHLAITDQIVATPVFTDAHGASIGPDPASITKTADGNWAVSFPAVGPVADAGYAMSVVVQAAPLGQPFAPAFPTADAVLGAGRPLRAIYADVGQRLFPATVWLNGLVPRLADDTLGSLAGSMALSSFLMTLAYWFGCGEDELGASSPQTSHSIFELLCESQATGAQLFPPPQHSGKSWQDALREAWIAELAKPDAPRGLLKDLANRLRAAGESSVAQDVDAVVSGDATRPLVADDVLHAWRITRAMTSGATTALSNWACWLQAVVTRMTTSMGGDAALGQALNARLGADALFAHDNPGEPNPQAVFLQDDCARLIAGKLDEAVSFWEDLHAAPNVSQALAGPLKTRILDAIDARQTLTPEQQTNADDYITAQAGSLATTDAPDAQSADDPALRIRYVAPASGKFDDTEANLRGYLICVRAGLPLSGNAGIDPAQPTAGPVWINDAEARLMHRDPVSGAVTTGAVLADDASQPIRLHDTIGATMNDGLLDIETEYDGHSLHALDVGSTDLMPALLNPCSPQNPPFPRIGYGMVYQGLVTMVDNAGVIIDSALRDAALPGEPLAPPDSAFKAPVFPYLSRQTPGLASFAKISDHGLTEETLAFATLAADARNTLETAQGKDLRDAVAAGELGTHTKVVVLFDGADYVEPYPNAEFTLRAPDCSARFIQRWLNTDWLSSASSAFRWDRIATATKDQIDQLIQSALNEAARQIDIRRRITNPAVVALRVDVTWLDEMGGSFDADDGKPATLRLPLAHVAAGPAWLWDEQFIVQAQRDARRQLKLDAKGYVVVTVPPGLRARFEVHSIVDPAYFGNGVRARLVGTLIDGFGTESDGLRASAKHATQWIESLSDAPVEVPAAFVSSFSLDYPKQFADRTELSVTLDSAAKPPPTTDSQAKLPARWLRGFIVAPRRWRWSGYPIDMPAAGAANPDILLEPWLPIYAGTDNSQPAHPEAAFSTGIDPAQGWVASGCVMQPVHLPPQRVAMHAGLELTPVLRFRSILKPAVVDRVERDARRRVFLYAVLRGASDWNQRMRLPVPVWSEHIPLTQTHRVIMPGDPQAQITAKGALLLFDDALYDTSDGATLGGIGERLDVDVLGTWRSGIDEIGPNPVFHGSPGALHSAPPMPRLVLDPPFGLSYDQAVTGAPVQTAAVLRPIDGDGRWLLARVRLRRYIDPDFRLDAPLQPVNGPGTAAARYTSGVRLSDSDWVPCDVTIVADEAVSSMQLFVDTAPYTLTVPADPARMPSARRYLVSWEKGRWSGAEPRWRAHVALQVRRGASSVWDTVSTVSGYEQTDMPNLHADSVVQVNVSGPKAAPLVRRVLMSDFTDARWVSLIGSFECAGLGDATRYAFRSGADGIRILSRDGAPLPVVRPNDDLRPTLLLLFRPQPDVMRGSLETQGGMLVGVYSATPAAAQSYCFDTAVLDAGDAPEGNCQAVLMSLQQRHTGSAPVTSGKDSWTSLTTSLFPPQQPSTTEASMRLLPEYLGPISAG